MKTFTFDAPDFGGLLDELNAGYIVTLTKANGAALILQHGNDIDGNGDEIIRFTIRPKAGADTYSTWQHEPLWAFDITIR